MKLGRRWEVVIQGDGGGCMIEQREQWSIIEKTTVKQVLVSTLTSYAKRNRNRKTERTARRRQAPTKYKGCVAVEGGWGTRRMERTETTHIVERRKL